MRLYWGPSVLTRIPFVDCYCVWDEPSTHTHIYIYIYTYIHTMFYLYEAVARNTVCRGRAPVPTFFAGPPRDIAAGLYVEYRSLQIGLSQGGLSEEASILLQTLSQNKTAYACYKLEDFWPLP